MPKEVKTVKPSVEGKIQGGQEVESADPAKIDNGADSSFKVEKSSNSGSILKQEKAAEAIASTLSGAPTVTGGASVRSAGRKPSGSKDGALGTSQAAPVGSNTRQDSRFSKKAEKVATKLNYTPSEQYERAYVESKPLAEAADKVQGYNGTYRNETYRTQKIAGTTPAELNYDRSVDYIEKDEVYFLMGQQIIAPAEVGSFDPSQVWDEANNQWIPNLNRVTRGNFVPRTLSFRFDNIRGRRVLTDVHIVTENITPEYNRALIQASASNAQMEINKIELIRETMENNAGDESKPGWNPLMKAIEDPNGWLSLLHAYEACLGGEALMASDKLSCALSFQLNRAQKDGQNTVTPMVEAFVGAYEAMDRSDGYGNAINTIWDQSEIAKGSAGSFIQSYDSVRKYNTKADFLLQPRSLKMHYVTGRNAMEEFFVDGRFVKAVANTECYATYGHAYDPTLPILMTDKAALVYPFDIGQVSHFSCYDLIDQIITISAYTKEEATAGFSSFDCVLMVNKTSSNATVHLHHAYGPNDGSWDISTDDDHKEVVLTANSTRNGADAEQLTISHENTGSGDVSVTVPAGYILVLRAPYTIAPIVNVEPTPIGAAQLVYAYSDRRNFYKVRVRNPLVAGIVRYLTDQSAVLANSYLNGQTYNLPIMHSTRHFAVWDLIVNAAMPYIQEERVNYMRDVLRYTRDFGYPFSDLTSLKEVSHIPFKYLGSNGPDSELTLGSLSDVAAIRWTMPEFFWDLGLVSGSTVHKFVAPWYVCENDYHQVSGTYSIAHEIDEFSICWPSTRAGIKMGNLVTLQSIDERQLRLALDIIVDITNNGHNNLTYPRAYKYGRATDGQLAFAVDGGLSIRALLSMPRQLGFVIDAPGGMLTTAANADIREVNWDADYSAVTSFRAYLYTNASTVANKAILTEDDMNVNRAANFVQVWNKIDLISPSQGLTTSDYGVLLGASMAFEDGTPRAGRATFSPFAALGTGAQDDATLYPTLFATHRYMYARFQQLPFIISPFDAVDVIDGGSSHCDIYDNAYIYGLCGFRASDYTEDVYNRETFIFNQGVSYTSDPWYSESEIAS